MNKHITAGYFLSLLTLIQYGEVFSQINIQSDTVINVYREKVPVFDEFFTTKSLRIDYVMAGDNRVTNIYFTGMRQEPFWGGSKKSVVDPFNYGTYRITAFDSATLKLIFSKGFCNLFQEWQGTPEAKTIKKAFSETAVLPFPRKTILFRIEKRDYDDGIFIKLFEMYINPKDYFIDLGTIHTVPFIKFVDSGPPENKVDVAFIAEGYTLGEMPKFMADAKRISDYWMSEKPFASYKDRFNFYAIESPSSESGITNPGHGQYVNTSCRSSFYTFDMDRYLTSFDSRDIYDIAANVPYDVIFILVNSKIYGGGGFFNFYGESTVDNVVSQIVSIHEFGHTFAGLADEYYTSEVTYSDFYNPKVEPWEPNITTNVDFDSKWKSLVTLGLPLPTPRADEYKNSIGLFEGGGYTSKGVYSPMMDCRMKSNDPVGFCPVCDEAIRKMIMFYSE
jgi:hypothetical protein